MDPVQKIISEFISKGGSLNSLTFMHATFIHAIGILEQLRYPAKQNEESITAGLFSALASSLPFCTWIFGTKGQERRACYWAQFKKTRPAVARPNEYEATTGADFVLAFRDGGGEIRIAIFQAKIPDVKGVDLYREGSSGRESQLVVLKAYAEKVVNACFNITHGGVVSKSVEGLTWVHYLIYRDRKPITIRLSRLQNNYDSEVSAHGADLALTENYVSVLPGDSTLYEVLLEGLESGLLLSKTSRSGAWLCISDVQAKSLLPKLNELADVLFIGDGYQSLDLIEALGLGNGEKHVIGYTLIPNSGRRLVIDIHSVSSDFPSERSQFDEKKTKYNF